MRRVLDRDTGTDTQVAIPCGSTRERVCPSCAAKARRLRIQQCAEGWHRDTEPETAPATTTRTTAASDDRARRGRRRAGWRGWVAAGTVHQATLGRAGPASGAGRGPHRGPDLHRPGWSGVPAVDVPHPHPAVLRGGAGGCTGRPGHLRLPPCRAGCGACFRGWWTGSGRTCAGSPATGCSTSPPSNRSSGWRRICTPRSGARSRAR